MPTSSTTMPPETSGIERSAQAARLRPRARPRSTAPGRSASKAEPPVPRRGIEASAAGIVPVLPSAKPRVAPPPSLESTTAARQSG